MTVKRRSSVRRGGVIYLPADEIECGLTRMRRDCEDGSLSGLAQSIAEHGLLEPITVRLRDGCYELVAGERRLLASRLAGLTEVPCVLLELDMEEASLIALSENLQRRGLDFVEEAEGIGQLVRLFGMSPEEAARRLGVPQEQASRALSLLRLPEDVLEGLRSAGLSAAHGMELLKLPDESAQRAALDCVNAHEMTAAEAEEYLISLTRPEPKCVFVMKDVRVFINSVSRGLELLRQGGIAAKMRQTETEAGLTLTVEIPRCAGSIADGGQG